MQAALVLFAMLICAADASPQRLPRPGSQQDETHQQESAGTPVVSEGEAGLAFLKQGRFSEAVQDLRRAVQREPGSWKYSLGLAEALLSSNYNFTGLRFLLKVKPRFQGLAEYRYILGLAYYLCYKYPEAIKEFKTFPLNDPRFNRIPFLIGNCYMAMSDLKEASVYFRKAIELNPRESAYYISLAKMLRMEGPEHLGEAIAFLQKALRLKPDDPYIRLHLADCEVGEHDYKDAQALLEQLVRDQPKFQPARLALAGVYEHHHDWAKARRQREIAAHLEPPKPVRIPGIGPVASTTAPQ
jgi:tetratricopeptide (TPR) repeat protein